MPPFHEDVGKKRSSLQCLKISYDCIIYYRYHLYLHKGISRTKIKMAEYVSAYKIGSSDEGKYWAE